MGSSSPLMMVNVLSNDFYSLRENKVVNLGHGGAGAVAKDGVTVVGSSHGWLALFIERNLEFFLWNPISGERVNLPSIDNLQIPEENMTRGYGCVHKVIVSSSSVDVDWRAIMSYGPEERLAFCCPGQSNSQWTTIGARLGLTDYGISFARTYEDFAYSSRLNRLLCVTMLGDLERWDLRDPLSPVIDCSNQERERDEEEEEEDYDENGHECGDYKHVVVAEHSNEVFIVAKTVVSGSGKVRCNEFWRKLPYDFDVGDNGDDTYFKTSGFKVYKIFMEGTKMSASLLEEGCSLNGLAIFIGINHSIALPAANYPGLNPDSIYFTDKQLVSSTSTTMYGYGGNEVGIFDYKNKTFDPCYYPNYHIDDIIKLTPLPVWFTPAFSEFTSKL